MNTSVTGKVKRKRLRKVPYRSSGGLPELEHSQIPTKGNGEIKESPVNRLLSDIPPDLLRFMQTNLNSFTKWDLIHFFHANPQTMDTAENIAHYIGRDKKKVLPELVELAAQGILSEHRLNDKSAYSLSGDSGIKDLLHRFVIQCGDRQFRVKAIYQIIQTMR